MLTKIYYIKFKNDYAKKGHKITKIEVQNDMKVLLLELFITLFDLFIKIFESVLIFLCLNTIILKTLAFYLLKLETFG